MTHSVITVRNLSKSFKTKEILTDISFEVNQGDCLALIGPNGAGKTTLMNCLLGDYHPTKGHIQVLGQTATNDELKARVGILFQENVIQQKLKVKEILEFQKEIYSNPLSDKEIDRLLGFSDQQKEQFADKLSGGQRRLLSFVQILVGQPEILVLDEPTAGMDTSTRKRFWEIIHDLKEDGKTIIYSSHYIEEVEHTADRILVLHQGKLLRDTTPYLMRAEEKEKVFTLPATYLSVVENLAIDELVIKKDTITFATKEASIVWQALQAANCSIEELEMMNRTLLDSIFDTTKEKEEA